ncbi:hypothetical protein NDU88_003258 [Pleurodeles waltl]|uniref:Uncharacterized protein n=1 Tax=Pleurodeles waltl TaxID=8319 RepID=A0AAV7Q9A1_PLEWA|nr:hypothetical protein NDU88_003258 [Pleurodeles waltl]
MRDPITTVPCLLAGHNIGDEEGRASPCFPALQRPQVGRCWRCGCAQVAHLSPRWVAATIYVVLVPRVCAPSGSIPQSGAHRTSDGGHSSSGARAAQVCRLRPDLKLDCRVLPPVKGGPGVPPNDCLNPKSRPTTDCLHWREKVDAADILVNTVSLFSDSVAPHD